MPETPAVVPAEERAKCPRCGAFMIKEGETYRCPCCGHKGEERK